jgi:hypothetical protein
MRVVSKLTLALSLMCCRRPPPVDVDASRPDEPDAFAPGAPRLRAPRCHGAGVTWLAHPAAGERYDDDAGLTLGADAGDPMFPAIESAALAVSGETSWALWHDARDRRMHLARAQRPEVSAALGAGDASEGVVAFTGPRRDRPVAAWAFDTPTGRAHTVRALDTFERGCTQPETRDEALALSLVATARGALVAWDDDDPGATGGRIKVQLVAEPIANGACGAVRVVSPLDHDAGDPLLVATPDGAAVVAWLAAHELERDQNNDTVTDVWALALDASGAAVGAPVRVTSTTGHRFGLAAAVSADGGAVWLAWRAVPESGSEARGDGGSVALTHIERGATGLTRVGDAALLTGATANPTGALRVFAYGLRERPAEVWWRERVGDAVVSMHRSLDATGRSAGEAQAEPALHGELPAAMDARGASGQWALRTPGGGVGVGRLRCDAPGR